MCKVTEQKFPLLYYLMLAELCIQFVLANAALFQKWALFGINFNLLETQSMSISIFFLLVSIQD